MHSDKMHAWIQKTTLRCAFGKKPSANSKLWQRSLPRACSIRWTVSSLKNMIDCKGNRKEKQTMLLCTKIRLEVSSQDAATLEFMQGKCRGLYNWWVMRMRDGE